MTKFRTDATKGGYKILNIIGPDIEGCYGGVVESPDGDFLGCTWGRYGIERDGEEAYYLIPLDEPKPDHKIEARLETLEERLDNLVAHHKHTESFAADIWQRLNHIEEGLSKRVEALEKDTDGTINNLFDRVNRVEHDNKESNTWGVRVNGDLQELHNRILRLERKTADTSDYHNLRLQIQDVEKQLEALEPRTKTDEKGVWVTTKTFWDACWSQVSVKGEPLEDLFERMAKQLGLEE